MAEAMPDLFDENPHEHLGGLSRLHPHDLAVARRAHLARMGRERAEDTPGHKKLRDSGRGTARERIRQLTDPDSFHELQTLRTATGNADSPGGDGVVTGVGRVHGEEVMVFAQDFSVKGGSLGRAHADKIVRLLRLAEKAKRPVVGLYDGGGARIQEGAMALDGCGTMFEQIVRLSGVVPQISVILGPCAGAAAYAPALTDVVFMVRGSGMMCLTGPDVVLKVTGEEVDADTLGGADVHGRDSGVATFVHDDEHACLDDVRYLLSMLPANTEEGPPHLVTDDPVDRPLEALLSIVPTDASTPYDVLDVIWEVMDQDTFLEFHASWAPNIVCGLGRLGGRPIGVVANQPTVLAGVIDIPASEKAARFVSWCDAFSIPLLTLVDVPGFMPGTGQERGGIIRHGAKLLHAYCSATVPRIQVILRKAYGGAYIVMDSPSTGSDLSYAWPSNELAVMGPAAAVEIIHRRDIAGATDTHRERTRLEQEYRARHLHPYASAHQGLVHEVIDPLDTRRILADGFSLLTFKTPQAPVRKRANSPL